MKYFYSIALIMLILSCNKDTNLSLDCPAEHWQQCIVGQWQQQSKSDGVGYAHIEVQDPDLLVLYSNNKFESLCSNCDNPKNFGEYVINIQDSTLYLESEVVQNATYRIFELKNKEILIIGRLGRHGYTEEKFIWVGEE